MRRFALLWCVLVMACGSSTEATNVTGSWQSGAWTMTLTQNGGVVSGAGQAPFYNAFAGANVPTAFSVTGSTAGNGFALTLAAQGYQPVNFSGSIQSSGKQIAGTLNGSGWNNQAISFNRQ